MTSHSGTSKPLQTSSDIGHKMSGDQGGVASPEVLREAALQHDFTQQPSGSAEPSDAQTYISITRGEFQ
jgi:hypothetical protein